MSGILHILDQKRLIAPNGQNVGGSIYFYTTGTLTPATIYSDAALTTPLTNPVVVAAGGLVPAIYLDGAVTYRRRVVWDDASLTPDDMDPYTLPDSVTEAQAAAALATAERTAAETASADAEADAEAAETARIAAQAAAVASQEYFPAARSHVPQGAVVGAATIGTAGSGGTNGTFALAFSGGNFAVNPTGTFTVAGGVVTAIAITGPGLYIGGSISAPTLSFAASSGLTGAAGTYSTTFLKTAGQYWLTDTSPASSYLALFQNQANAAVEIDAQFDPMSAGAAAASAADIVADRAAVNGTLSELVAGTWTSTTTGSYLRQDTGASVTQAAWGYKSYTISADDVRDVNGKVIVELTFQLNTPSSAVAAAIYFDSLGAVIGREYIGAGVNIPLQTQLLDVPVNTVTIVADYQLSVFVPTFRVRRVSGDIAERLTTQETQNAVVPEMETALVAWVPEDYTYIAGSFVNSSGALQADATFRYFEYTLDGTERGIRVSGSLTAGSGVRLVNYYNGSTWLGSSVAQYPGIGASTKDTFADRVLTVPSNATRFIIFNRTYDDAISLEIQRIDTTLITRVEALEASTGATGPITVWGESTGTTTNGIFDELQALYPSRTLSMQAIGGQTFVDQVRFRLGVAKTTITITGNQIPTSGTAACTLANDILKPPASTTNSMQVMVAGVRCNLTRTGDASTGTYAISAIDSIGSARAVSAGSEVTVLTGFVSGSDPAAATPLATLLSGTNVFLCYWNDRFSTDYPGLANTLAAAVEHVSRYSTRQLWVSPHPVQVMLPTTDATAGTASSEAQSYGFLDHTRMMRRLMANITPRHFDNTQFLIDAGATQAKTISGVSFQVATTAASTPYISAGDTTHFNATGQTAQAAAIKASLDGAGW